MIDIKLRAWDKKSERMYYVDAIDFSGNSIIKGNPSFITDIEGGCFLLKDSVIMLYSSRKDINNQEIYDRDIIEYCNMICLVMFWNAHFIVAGEKGRHEDLWKAITRDSNLKVIGNYFENPKLFDDSKLKYDEVPYYGYKNKKL